MEIRQFKYLSFLILAFVTLFFPVTVFAAPAISITKGNPGSQVSAPYTFSFSVQDAQGLSSVTVNGRETGPNGTDFYEVDWTTNYNGSFNIVAINTAGERSLKTVDITNITVTGNTSPPQTTAAPPPQTAADPPPPTTAAPTQPPPTPAPTQPQTTAATTQPQTTAMAEQTELEQTETVPSVETAPGGAESQHPETDSSASLEGMTETSALDESDTFEELKATEPETTEDVTEAPTIPPDSYRLSPGGKPNNTIPIILVCGCVFGIVYCTYTIRLNKRRLKAYKELRRILILRQKQKSLNHNGDDDNVGEDDKNT